MLWIQGCFFYKGRRFLSWVLVVDLLGAQVILTDLPDRLRLLKNNVEDNLRRGDLRGSAAVSELTWGDEPDPEINVPLPDFGCQIARSPTPFITHFRAQVVGRPSVRSYRKKKKKTGQKYDRNKDSKFLEKRSMEVSSNACSCFLKITCTEKMKKWFGTDICV